MHDTPPENPPLAAPDVMIRLIQPDDAPRLQGFMASLSDESRYFRFLDAIRELPPKLLRYFVEIDFDCDMALVAVIDAGTPAEAVVGVGRYYGNDDGSSCEFALAVSDAWHHHGLGHRLMQALFECAIAHGYRHIHGDVLGENTAMLRLMLHLGFGVRTSPEDPTLKIVERALLPLPAPPVVAALADRKATSTPSDGTFRITNSCP